MYELWVKRAGEWHIIGQYASHRQAKLIAGDYRKRGETVKVVRPN